MMREQPPIERRITKPEIVLGYLMANEGILCTYQELLDHIAENDYKYKHNDLYTAVIHSARALIPIDRGEKQGTIFSIHGYGYVYWTGENPPKTFSDLGVTIYTEDSSGKKRVDGISVLPPETIFNQELQGLPPLFEGLITRKRDSTIYLKLSGQQRNLLGSLVSGFERVLPYSEIEENLYPNDNPAIDNDRMKSITQSTNSIRLALKINNINLILYSVDDIGFLLSAPLNLETDLLSLNIVSEKTIDSMQGLPFGQIYQEIARLCNLAHRPDKKGKKGEIIPFFKKSDRDLLFYLALTPDKYHGSRTATEIIQRFWLPEGGVVANYLLNVKERVYQLKRKLRLANSILEIIRISATSEDFGAYYLTWNTADCSN